jgi:hypothetical protein
MDEMQLIRGTLAAAPPSARATAQARDRLASAIAPYPKLRERRRAPLWWSLTGAAVAAGVAGVVLMTATTPGQPERAGPGIVGAQSPGQPGEATAPVEVAAKDLLLAAATTASSAETGRYWRVKAIHVYGPYQVGTGASGYDLIGRSMIEHWVARNPRERSRVIERHLGHRPRGAADQRAWRAAGSPQRWRIASDSVTGWIEFTMRPGEVKRRPFYPSNYLQELGGFDLGEVQALPTEPAALRELFVRRIAAGPAGSAPGSWRSNEELFRAMTDLLVDIPAPPPVRAAAFTVIAEIPGVRSVGEVTDVEGRPGTGVELRHTAGDIGSSHQLVVDPATHLVLASSDAGRVDGGGPVKERSRVILAAGWTDEAPVR